MKKLSGLILAKLGSAWWYCVFTERSDTLNLSYYTLINKFHSNTDKDCDLLRERPALSTGRTPHDKQKCNCFDYSQNLIMSPRGPNAKMDLLTDWTTDRQLQSNSWLWQILRTIDNLARRTPTRDLQVTFRTPYLYDFITELYRQQAAMILNHENVNFRCIGRSEDQLRKYKRLKIVVVRQMTDHWALSIICYTNLGWQAWRVHRNAIFQLQRYNNKSAKKLKQSIYKKLKRTYVYVTWPRQELWTIT
jgi:hypothetical protein